MVEIRMENDLKKHSDNKGFFRKNGYTKRKRTHKHGYFSMTFLPRKQIT